jgi:hypothetical protein
LAADGGDLVEFLRADVPAAQAADEAGDDGRVFLALEGRGQFAIEDPACAHGEILVDDAHAPFAGQDFPRRLLYYFRGNRN